MTPQQRVKAFNASVIVGDPVVLVRPDGNAVETSTRAKAQVMSDGNAAIWLDLGLGSHPLERVTAKFPRAVR